MTYKNDSSQMKQCLSHVELGDKSGTDSREGSSGQQAPKQGHSHPFSEKASGSGSPPDTGEERGNTSPIHRLKKEPECHMQLDKLCSNKNHTVLIDTDAFQNGRLLPFKGHHVWDSNHVKLPSNFPSKSGLESRWKTTQRALQSLTKTNASVKDIETAIMSYNHAYKSEWGFDALYSYVSKVQRQENNFSNVISKIAKLALQLPEQIRHPIPLLRQNQSHSITLSQVQISCLLANAFFCTFPHRNSTKPGSEYATFPTINFSSLFGNMSLRKIQKLRALFHYFNTVTEEETKPDGLVTFERICIPKSELPVWRTKKETLTNLHVSPVGSIEKDGKGMLQVDFACNFIGGGVLGRGLVQEEIRFLMSPELIVARLFTEKLEDNECLKITGVQTYSIYSGYSDSFEWQGPFTDKTKSDEWRRRYCQIVAIDALFFKNPREQYTEENIKRELNKAYIGFRKDPNTPPEYTSAIATGNWGCGAFNGDPKLKALIQMMAAAVAQRDLAFFTFGNKLQAQELQSMHDILKSHTITVGDLYLLLKDFCNDYSHSQHKSKDVFEYIKEKKGSYSSHL